MPVFSRFTPGLCLSGLLFSSSALAVETIVITAGRVAQPAAEAPAPLTVVPRETIEQGASADAAEVLRQHSGAEITRNGGPGQSVSVFLRGTESNHSLILLDGVKLNPGTLGTPALQNIPAHLIERVEIVKGPQSTLYGSEAMGGVINLITRKVPEEDGLHPSASVRGGSFGTYQGNARLGYRQGDDYLGLDVSALTSDGYSPRADSDLKRGHDNLSLRLGGGYRFNSSTDLEASYWQAQGNLEYLDFMLEPVDQDFTNRAARVSLNQRFTSNWQARLGLNYGEDKIDQNQSADYAHTERTGLDWQHDWRLNPDHQLTLGLSGSLENTASSVFGSGYDEETWSGALFAQDDLRFGDHRLLLAARYTEHEDFGGQATGSLNYSLNLGEATRLLAGVGTAYRAPDSTDRFGYGGNPDLEPETSRHWEIGLRHALAPGHSLEATLFQTRLRDLISFEDPDGFNGPQPGYNVNVGKARIRGLEAGHAVRMGDWRFGLQGLWQNARNLETGTRLARRAHYSLTASIGYEVSVWYLNAYLNAAGRRRDSDFGDNWLGGYATVNLSAGYQLNRAWQLRAKVNNLFDRDYELAGGYQTGGRAAYLEVVWNGG